MCVFEVTFFQSLDSRKTSNGFHQTMYFLKKAKIIILSLLKDAKKIAKKKDLVFSI